MTEEEWHSQISRHVPMEDMRDPAKRAQLQDMYNKMVHSQMSQAQRPPQQGVQGGMSDPGPDPFVVASMYAGWAEKVRALRDEIASGPFLNSREGALALTKLDEARLWLQERANASTT